jgi:hypothetical protein
LQNLVKTTTIANDDGRVRKAVGSKAECRCQTITSQRACAADDYDLFVMLWFGGEVKGLETTGRCTLQMINECERRPILGQVKYPQAFEIEIDKPLFRAVVKTACRKGYKSVLISTLDFD